MAVELVGVVDDLMTARISGLLREEELTALQMRAAEMIQRTGMVRFFVIVEEFEGWAKEGDWGNVWFQSEYDEGIEKMAIVGDMKWEELARVFTGQGARRFPIRYFSTEEIDAAREWIAEPA